MKVSIVASLLALLFIGCQDASVSESSQIAGVAPSAMETADNDTYYYWGEADKIVRAECADKQQITVNNCTDEKTTRFMIRHKFETKLKRMLAFFIPKKNSEIAKSYREIIEAHRKQLPKDSDDIRKKRQVLITEAELKLSKIEPQTIESAFDAIMAVVATPKDLLIAANSILLPYPSILGDVLNLAFIPDNARTIAEIESKIRKLQSAGLKAFCRFDHAPYSKWRTTPSRHDEEYGPRMDGSSIRIYTAAPQLMTEYEGIDFCAKVQMIVPYTSSINDQRNSGINDFNDPVFNDHGDAHTCHWFARSELGKQVPTFSRTGSNIVPSGKIVWLNHPGRGNYMGLGFPRERAHLESQAYFIGQDGACHENAPAYLRVDPFWKLSTICASENEYFLYEPFEPGSLSIPCDHTGIFGNNF